MERKRQEELAMKKAKTKPADNAFKLPQNEVVIPKPEVAEVS